MFRSTAGAMVVLLSVGLAGAARAQEVPFAGVVVHDGTKVRAGAGRAYYVVGELAKGEVVQVDEVIFGWNKIVSPPGVHSYISKMYVDAKGSGELGYVNSDRVEVKAGSIKGPGESYRGQVSLNKGDAVAILAEEGSFYKITPPKGAYVFLPPGSVRRVNPEQLAAVKQTPAASQTQPTDTPAAPEAAAQAQPEAEAPTLRAAMEQQPPTPPTPAIEADTPDGPPESTDTPGETNPAGDDDVSVPTPAADDDAPALQVTPASANADAPDAPDAPAAAPADDTDTDANSAVAAGPFPAAADDDPSLPTTQAAALETAAVSDRLKALESRMIPLFMQPLEDQPIDRMIQAYQTIQRQSLPPIDRKIVSLRLAVLQRNRDLAAALRTIEASTSETTEVSLPDAVPQPLPGAPIRYDAVGRLLASSVYDGVNLPRMFRVVDPASGRTILWVEPGGLVNAYKHLGKVVGIVGPQQYDPALKFNVLDVRRIDILEAQPSPPTQDAAPAPQALK